MSKAEESEYDLVPDFDVVTFDVDGENPDQDLPALEVPEQIPTAAEIKAMRGENKRLRGIMDSSM
jgi:hypothetical protein